MPYFNLIRTIWSVASVEADSETQAREALDVLNEIDWEEFDRLIEVEFDSED